jgi:hypothetical protein
VDVLDGIGVAVWPLPVSKPRQVRHFIDVLILVAAIKVNLSIYLYGLCFGADLMYPFLGRYLSGFVLPEFDQFLFEAFDLPSEVFFVVRG